MYVFDLRYCGIITVCEESIFVDFNSHTLPQSYIPLLHVGLKSVMNETIYT